MASQDDAGGNVPQPVGSPENAAVLGVRPFQARREDSTDDLVLHSIELLKEKGILTEGDLAIVTAGVLNSARKYEQATATNIMRVVNVGA